MTHISRLVKALVWIALGVAAAVVLGWWLARLLRQQEDDTPEEAYWTPPQRPMEVPIPFSPEDETVAGAAAEDAPPADFTRIEGIGPKYAAGLVALGITTFEQLSRQDPETLAERLRAQGLRVIGDRIVQDDWPAQARRLVAEG